MNKKILLLIFTISCLLLRASYCQEEKIIDLSFNNVIKADSIDKRIKSNINYLTKFIGGKSIGNKKFSDYKIFGYNKPNEIYLEIYAFAFCQNYNMIDGKLNNGVSKTGIIKITLGNRFNKHLTSGIIWQEGDISKYDEILQRINPYQIDNVDSTKIFSNLKENAINQAKEYFIVNELFKDLGFIKKIYKNNDKIYLDIDFVQWLTGDEAKNAAKEDGYIGCCPNNYYVRNQNPQIRTYEVSENVKISSPYPRKEQSIANLIAVGEMNEFLCEISMEKNIVIKISEWYRP